MTCVLVLLRLKRHNPEAAVAQTLGSPSYL